MQQSIKHIRLKIQKVQAIINNQDSKYNTPALYEYRSKYLESLHDQLNVVTYDMLYQLPNFVTC